MQPIFNQTLLMSGAQYISNASPINTYMNSDELLDINLAIEQHTAIKEALEHAGVKVIVTAPPPNCQDGVFTANWGLSRGRKILMSNQVPPVRRPEAPYAKELFIRLGLEVTTMPESVMFSGQGDALPCGNYAFIGTGYRTDKEAHKIIADRLGYQVIGLQTVPKLDDNGQLVINKETGRTDSFFYDLDLAIAILYPPSPMNKGLIAWCPEAFVPESQELIRSLDFVEKIEVPFEEAVTVSACNLVSTGRHVVMNANAPKLKSAIESYGLEVTALHNEELAKNGGSVRCTTLTLFND